MDCRIVSRINRLTLLLQDARFGVADGLDLARENLLLSLADLGAIIFAFHLLLCFKDFQVCFQALALDLVGLAVARQAAVEANERAQGYILSLLNGDADYSMAALSTFSGKVQTAASFDSSIVAAGNITFKAWLKWLTQRSNYRVVTHVVSDLTTLLALRNMLAAEKTTQGPKDNPSIDIGLSVVNPNWPAQIKFVLTDDPNWPANTIMGVDGRYGVHRVNSLTAQYSAIEAFAMKRSTMLRVDSGEIVYRFMDEAFEVLTLTV